MKKIILAFLIQFATLSADYVIKADGTLILQTSQSTTTTPPADTWSEAPLPTQAFNVLDYGLKGDGVTDDSAALKELAKNTDVTNWYFPAGKTFKLHYVYVPSHVEAIYGNGTIRAYDNGNTDETKAIHGALRINQVGYPAHEGIIVDGLIFDAPDFISRESYAVLELSGNGGATNNIEIRNCIFRNTSHLNGFKAFSAAYAGRSQHNLKVHDNVFYNVDGYFAVELIGTIESGDGFPGLDFHDNHIYDSSAGISIINTESPTAHIYNNLIENTGMCLETAGCSGINLHHNTVLGATDILVSDGSKDNPDLTHTTVKKCYYYNNHLESSPTGYLQISGGSTSEFYENFILGSVTIRLEGASDGFPLRFGNIHDNTFVGYDGQRFGWEVISVYDPDGRVMDGGTITNNDIYANKPNEMVGIRCNNVTANVNLTANNIHMKGTYDCIIPNNATETDNVCTQSYAGDVPTSRVGAGRN